MHVFKNETLSGCFSFNQITNDSLFKSWNMDTFDNASIAIPSKCHIIAMRQNDIIEFYAIVVLA